MIRLLLCLAVALALLTSACGGGDGNGVSTPSPTATLRTATPAVASETPGASAMPTPPGATPTAAATPAPAGFPYTVQPGDTLYSIARRFGTTVAAIVQANNLSDPGQISAGQVLLIPAAGTPPPTATPSGGMAQEVRRGNPGRMTVAFSFDAGADAGYTALILDVLKANGIHASFGMTGKWAEQNPDLLKRIGAEGHGLINHTYDHASFTGESTGKPPLTQAERWQELDQTEAIVQSLVGVTTKPYFRPPYGDFDQSVNEDVGARGYLYNIMWTVDSRGWTGISGQEITQRCLQLAEPGAIYVFHVGSASQDGPALPGIIDGLRAAG